MGLQSMAHRAAIIGATLTVQRDGARGAAVKCWLPQESVAHEPGDRQP
jgi:nitrate/nitrite-specific signal transduction histidine kinase